MVNVELFRNEGVPEANISEYLILHPKSFTANRFVEILRKVKGMGFDHLESTFLKAVHMLTIMSEASWRNKMDVYKTCGGWTEDQIQSALRKDPGCMKASEKKIMAVMDFLVNEMSYDSSIVAENPIVFCCSLEDKIIPRCSVIRVLVSRGLIKENISLGTLATLVDESFLEKFVTKYEQEVPGLMKRIGLGQNILWFWDSGLCGSWFKLPLFAQRILFFSLSALASTPHRSFYSTSILGIISTAAEEK
ncbi:hypothetical protein C5167_044959 [Papaver somniferum]|uniref:Uncharacterized protein n=1 Tax=Papaver somniferum TaxID=3469 RepID=A0A4Y7LBY6_PAPSO|nr:hypothetical protein C5167_044959 [Papaver somniferum]